MDTHVLVDWVAEEGLDQPARPVDDWTAGDEPDFTVRAPRRRRMTGHPTPERPEPQPEPQPEVRTVTVSRAKALPEVAPLREVQERRRPARRPVDHAAASPDRIAMWAVALGFVLILIASLSA